MEPFPLERICERFRSELRRLLARRAAARLVVAAVALLAGLIGLDWLVRFGRPGRLALLAAFAAPVAFLLLRDLIGSVRRKWTDPEVLSYLDAVDPQRRDALVSLYELRRPAGIGETVTAEGRALVARAAEELSASAGAARPADALDRRPVRRWQGAAAVALLVAVAVSAALPRQVGTGLRRIFLPLSGAKWPTLTTLEVLPPAAGWRIPQGEDLQVVTRVAGQRPAELELKFTSRSTDYWITERVAVDDAGQAVYTFQDVAEPVTFYLRGGDDRTERFHVEIIERPRIKGIVAYYTYPPYARLARQKIASGQLRGLEGTEVRIDFESSTPLRSAVFVLAGRPAEPMTLTSPTTFTKSLRLRRSGQYAVRLTDLQGFREYRPERYDIQVTPDAPPEVRLLSPAADVVATRQASLKFFFEARDDFGLEEVTFLHAIQPGGKPAPLSDHVTGPIPQKGTESRCEFVWDFAKMELIGNVDVTYWVRARDCNPTGGGVTESPRRKVSLLDPTDFQLQILYEAKRVLAEARIAYRHQKKAYYLALDWAAKLASGKADDEKWREIVETQDRVHRAAGAVARWMQELNGHIQRNRMEDAFMSNRLGVIEDLRRGAAEKLALARAALARAHPATAADAEAERLKAARLKALAQALPSQKMATVGLGRLLRKLYDWENLQTALVNTKLLRRRQAEIHQATRQAAPRTIGREAEDLDDKTLEEVLALAQRQTAVTEAETNLESQLARIALKADAEGRRTVKRYLVLAYGYLRDVQVNQSLKQIARRIANNQLSDVTKDQLDVLTAMKVVEGGLVKAGKDARSEDPVRVADLLRRQTQEVEIARVEPDPDDAGEAETVRIDEAAVQKLLEEVVPMGEDALSEALLALAERQDDVRSRTLYLARTLTDDDMPRYKRLKMGVLTYRQGLARRLAAEKVKPLLAKSPFAPQAGPWFDAIAGQIDGVGALLRASDLSEANAALQAHAIASVRDIAGFLARQARLKDLADEHTRSGGVDEFDRAYVMAGEDLTRALRLYEQVDWGRTVQASLARASEWLRADPAGSASAEMTRLRQAVQEQTAKAQADVAAQLATAGKQAAGFSAKVAERVAQAGWAELAQGPLVAAAGKIRQGRIDPETRRRQDGAARRMGEVLGQIRQLLDERVALAEQVAEAPAAPTATGPATTAPAGEKTYYTEEELARQTTPEAIKASLASSEALDPAIRALMLKHLPKTFPEKYRRLVGAYYRDLLEARPSAPDGKGESP